MKSRLRAAQEVMTARTGGTGVSGRRELRGVGAARSDVGAAPVPACSRVRDVQGLAPYANALRTGLSAGLGYRGLCKMMKEEHCVEVSDKTVRMWIDAEQKPGAASMSSSSSIVVRCQADLDPYSDASRSGMADGHGYKALRAMPERDFVSTVGPLFWVDV